MFVADRPRPLTAGPVFIVGPSRSGTTMLAQVLTTAGIGIAGETHYFDDLRPRLPRGALRPAAADVCERYFLALAHRPYGHGGDPSRAWLTRDRLRSRARAREDSADAYFETFCTAAAARAGCERWGEKTPRHVFCIDDLLRVFPDACVLCTTRDPRAVAASYAAWRAHPIHAVDSDPGYEAALALEWRRVRHSYHPALTALLWRGAMRAARHARERWGERAVRLVRYEDLVERPVTTFGALGDWLGVELRAKLARTSVVNSSYTEVREQVGMRTDSVALWRTALPRADVAVVESICRREMTRLGYRPDPGRATPASVAVCWLRLPGAALRAIAANRARLRTPVRYLGRRLGVQL